MNKFGKEIQPEQRGLTLQMLFDYFDMSVANAQKMKLRVGMSLPIRVVFKDVNEGTAEEIEPLYIGDILLCETSLGIVPIFKLSSVQAYTFSSLYVHLSAIKRSLNMSSDILFKFGPVYHALKEVKRDYANVDGIQFTLIMLGDEISTNLSYTSFLPCYL